MEEDRLKKGPDHYLSNVFGWAPAQLWPFSQFPSPLVPANTPTLSELCASFLTQIYAFPHCTAFRMTIRTVRVQQMTADRP